MKYSIEPLLPEDFHLCNNIWNMEHNRDLADQFYTELVAGTRVTFVCKMDGAFVGEISLVYDKEDDDYTIPGRRVYLSRLMVKSTHRRQGIGTALCDHLFQYAKEQGYTELSLGVDLDNYAALKLYSGLGFSQIILIGQDDQGPYVKLLKKL